MSDVIILSNFAARRLMLSLNLSERQDFIQRFGNQTVPSYAGERGLIGEEAGVRALSRGLDGFHGKRL